MTPFHLVVMSRTQAEHVMSCVAAEQQQQQLYTPFTKAYILEWWCGVACTLLARRARELAEMLAHAADGIGELTRDDIFEIVNVLELLAECVGDAREGGDTK